MEETMIIKESHLLAIIERGNEAKKEVKALKEVIKELKYKLGYAKKPKPKVTGIEKRFQEDMINEMDSQY